MACDLRKPYAQCRCARHKAIKARLRNLDRMGRDTRASVDATGTRRRIQALARMGWSLREVAARSGVAPMTLSWLTTGQHKRVNRRTANAIAKVFDDLGMTHAPASRASSRAKRWALAQGWAPALAFDDIDNEKERPKGVRVA